MKYLKITLVAFIFTFAFSAFAVNAVGNWKGYVGLSLPGLKGTITRGPHTKTETGLQYYENTGNINSCTGNENGIQARVESEAGGNSAYLTISGGGQSGSWSNTSVTTTKRAYTLRLRNNTTSPCKSSHSGFWYLDRSAYLLLH